MGDIMKIELQEKLVEYALDPENPLKNYDLAKEYYKIDQTAAAFSFFLRAAERSDDVVLKYKCLIYSSQCFVKQTRRNITVEGLLQHAVQLQPNRQEGYYFLSLFYSINRRWREASITANIGIQVTNDQIVIDEYPGKNYMKHIAASARWNDGQHEKARNEYFDLRYKTKNVDNNLKNQLDKELNNIRFPDIIPYNKKDLDTFKFPFVGIETIEKNYSKHLQDMFILSVFNGKKNGTYLEIGSYDPFYTNNTALLETKFDWKGISIDKDKDMCVKFNNKRKSQVLCADATKIDYEALLSNSCYPTSIDYLQIDCDDYSLDVLERIPFDKYKFGLIQLEHDYYRLGDKIRDKSREILKQNGYILLVNDIAFDTNNSYEDWWIHPSIVKINKKMKTNNNINFIGTYMFEQ